MSKKSDIIEYRDEFSNWLKTLEPFQDRFKTNYKRYTGYSETQGTEAKISDPATFELTERVVQKLFEREPKFYAEANKNLPKEVKRVIQAVAEHFWNNQDMVQHSGTMRSRFKVFGREFIVTGNGAVESYWNGKSDSPDMRIIPIEDVVFDPAKTLKTSPIYYIRQFVSLDYLKDNVEVKKDGEIVAGMFKSAAIKKLERLIDGKGTNRRENPSTNLINRNGTDNQRKVDEFQLVSRWEGGKCCRFVMDDDLEEPILVQEFESVLGDDPLDFAMDVEVVKEPYAISMIDPQAGLFKAKDLLLCQTVDYGAKGLNPPTIINPNGTGVNLKTVVNMYKLGGIVLADPTQIKQADVNQAPVQTGLNMLNFIQGRNESISGLSPYTGGITGAASDKTQGTMGGIEALIQQGISPIRDRQQNIEESIIEPMVNKWLKMVGATMSDKDFKWVLITGEDPKVIKVTKGFLTGKIKLQDLMDAGIVEDAEIQGIVDEMMANDQDPEKEIMFDVDWVIRVETGSLAEQDTAKDVENKKMLIDSAIQLISGGIPLSLDFEKLWKDMAQDAGVKEPDQYLNKEVMNGQQGVGGPAGIPAENPNAPQGAGMPGSVPGMAGAGMPANPIPAGSGPR